MQAKGDLFTIGEFSKITGMGIHSLRYYDEIGALKPEYVDPVSNYRYYSFAQLKCVPGINMCIDAGIKLSDFSSFISNGVIDYSRIIADSKTALNKRIEEFSKQKELLEEREKQLTKLREIDENEIVSMYFNGQSIWAVPVESASIPEDESDILISLSKKASRHGCQISPSFFGMIQIPAEAGIKQFIFSAIDSVSDFDKASPYIISLKPGDYLLRRCNSCFLKDASERLTGELSEKHCIIMSFTVLGESLGLNPHFSAVTQV